MKGWTVFETGEGALEDDEVAAWFAAFQTCGEVSSFFDLDRSRGSYAGRYAIKVLKFYFTEETQRDSLRGKALAALKEYALKAPPSPRNCYCVMEPSPVKRHQNVRMGRAKGLLIKHIPEQYLRMEWATATIYIKPPGKGTLLLCQWNLKTGWKAQDSLMREASQDELNAANVVREMEET